MSVVVEVEWVEEAQMEEQMGVRRELIVPFAPQSVEAEAVDNLLERVAVRDQQYLEEAEALQLRHSLAPLDRNVAHFAWATIPRETNHRIRVVQVPCLILACRPEGSVGRA